MVAPRIAVSIGDFNGIGPEVILRTFKGLALPLDYTPIIVGPQKVLEFYARRLDLHLDYHTISHPDEATTGQVNLLTPEKTELNFSIAPGSISAEAGQIAMQAIRKSVELALDHKVGGMVTAPISKEAIRQAGYSYPGHTEFLADLCGCSNYVMMMLSKTLRIGLATTHIALRDVPGRITRESVLMHLRVMNASLKHDFGISSPKIAVLGLNPHAGDGGVMGTEESEHIHPAIEQAVSEGILAEGSFPADSFFGKKHHDRFEAVLAMYHDQGLVPFKSLSFNSGVNFTAGLPIIRCSPDHGTAFDIAGTGKADTGSMIQAIKQTVRLTHLRAHNQQNHVY